MKKLILLPIFLVAILVSGCLTTQFKIYKFTLNKDLSGTLEIVYYNIFSQVSESEDADSVASEDYQKLLEDYIAGEEATRNYQNVSVLKKELFEENGVLCGRVLLKFNKPEDVKLYRYDKNSPWMYKYSSDESFHSSNGEKKFDDYPIVFWPKNHKGTFELTTSISNPDENDVSLLKFWKK